MVEILPPQDNLPAETKKEIAKIAESYIEADNILVWIINQAGQLFENSMDKLPNKTKMKINKVIQPALQKVFDMAVNLHEREQELDQNENIKKLKAKLKNRVFKSSNQVAATLSGLVGGVGGTATTLLELPVAFGLIFKEILKVSAEYGRDPKSESTRMECLAIFLSGTSLEEDDYSDSGFISARRLISLRPQPQHVGGRRTRAFRLANSVELTGFRLFRGASDMISRDRPAIRVRTADSGTRLPSGAASPRFRSALGLRSGFGRGDVLPGRRPRPEARVEQREEAVSAPTPPVPTE